MKLLFDQNLSFKLCTLLSDLSLTPNRFESLVSTDPTIASFGSMPKITASCSSRRIRILRIWQLITVTRPR
jgi:hypothetical protein